MSEVSLPDILLEEKHWDAKKRIIKSSHPRATFFNRIISNRRKELEDSYFTLFEKESEFTVKDIIHWQNKNHPKSTLSSYLENYIEANPDNLTRGTLMYHTSFLNKWNEENNELSFKNISKKIIQDFMSSLIKQGYKTNTVHSRMKILRKMLLRAKEDGLISINPMSSIKLKQEKGNREYLTTDELILIEQTNPGSQYHQLVKDVFLFGCYTGLRISDIATLKNSDIKNETSGVRVHKRMGKTKEFAAFKLNNDAERILKKYTSLNESYVFPMLRKFSNLTTEQEKRKVASTNASMNKALKDIIRKARIDKHISMHCGRHTFAVISLTKGADLYVLSKVLGHTSIITTEIYAQIMDKRKDELTDLWNKI